MKKQKENSREGITWSEMGKQNVQAEKVYYAIAIAIATFSDWPKNLTPVFQPMRSKSKTNRTFLWFFPRFEQVTDNCLEFWLGPRVAQFTRVGFGWSSNFGIGFSTVIWKPLHSGILLCIRCLSSITSSLFVQDIWILNQSRNVNNLWNFEPRKILLKKLNDFTETVWFINVFAIQQFCVFIFIIIIIIIIIVFIMDTYWYRDFTWAVA